MHTTFTALGDSFTEGLGDPLIDGSLRGWADLVAAGLAERSPGLRYANLAVRGRRFAEVEREQVPVALEMRPDLASFEAGGNDALRPGVDLDPMMARFERVVARLSAAGADVLLFRFPDMSVRLPLPRVLRPRIVAMNEAVSGIAERHGAYVVDLFADRALDDPRYWSHDRIHLNEAGHRRVAAHALTTLGIPTEPHPAPPAPRTSDLRWASSHLGPWLRRRLTGRSSGDARLPKRPELSPL